MSRFRLIAVAWALMGAALLQAQTQTTDPQQPVFRTRLESVAVPVTVFDLDEELVTTLTRDDFTIFDNGHKQDITTFSSGLQPLRAVALVDVSASMMPAVDLAMSAAEQFVIRLRPDDRARVGIFSSRSWMSPQFTADRDALLSWLHHDLPFNNPTKLFDAIDAAVTDLTSETGRRVVVVFTDGCDTASATGWSAILQRIRAEDVMVYAVMFHPHLTVKPPEQHELSFGYQGPGPSHNGTNEALGPCTLHHFLELSNATPLKDAWKMDDPRWTRGAVLMDELAAETGGSRIQLTPADEINHLFTRIMNELHYSYLLSFTPQTLDGKVHEIGVRVTDKRLAVRARQHYLAPLGPAAAAKRNPL